MLYLILKAAISGVLVMVISEVARRSPGIGGLIASLPLATYTVDVKADQVALSSA